MKWSSILQYVRDSTDEFGILRIIPSWTFGRRNEGGHFYTEIHLGHTPAIDTNSSRAQNKRLFSGVAYCCVSCNHASRSSMYSVIRPCEAEAKCPVVLRDPTSNKPTKRANTRLNENTNIRVYQVLNNASALKLETLNNASAVKLETLNNAICCET